MAVIKTNFLSQCLGRQTDVNVIIPTYAFRHTKNGIDPYEHGKKFKVLILLHGFSDDCNKFLSSTNIALYAEDHDLAVIMPNGYNSNYTDDPNGVKVHSFIVDELLKVCSFLFPISTQREDVFIGGISMGAMGAMKLALVHPEKFSAVLCMSGACAELTAQTSVMDWFGNSPQVFQAPLPGNTLNYAETQEDAYFYAKKNLEDKKVLPLFRLTVGSDDFLLNKCRYAKNKLMELGYSVDYEEVDGYGHDWNFWDLKLREAIENWLPL